MGMAKSVLERQFFLLFLENKHEIKNCTGEDLKIL